MLGNRTMKELVEYHSATLQELEMAASNAFDIRPLVPILTNCHRLEALVVMYDGRFTKYRRAFLGAELFIDQDLHEGSLRSWACEGSMKLLTIKVLKIPSPYEGYHDDNEGEGKIHVKKEEFPGQGRQVQQKAYERLARFKNLETL